MTRWLCSNSPKMAEDKNEAKELAPMARLHLDRIEQTGPRGVVCRHPLESAWGARSFASLSKKAEYAMRSSKSLMQWSVWEVILSYRFTKMAVFSKGCS